MKTLFCAALMLSSLALPAAAADVRTLAMGGHGEEKAIPDAASINAGVTSNATTAASALAANTTRMKGVFAALERLGVAARNIQTSSFNISPQYSGGDNNAPPHLTGYQVSNQVTVRLDDVPRLGATLDALVGAGANQMNGIGFEISDPAPLLEKARADAVADAQARAQTYAKAAGVTLGPILSISEGGDGPRPMFKVAMMAPRAGAVPVAAGEQSVTADVSIVWEIH